MGLFNVSAAVTVHKKGWWRVQAIIDLIAAFIGSLGDNTIVVREGTYREATDELRASLAVSVSMPSTVWDKALEIVTPYASGVSTPENGAFALLNMLCKEIIDDAIADGSISAIDENTKLFINIILTSNGKTYHLKRIKGQIKLIDPKSLFGPKGAANSSKSALQANDVVADGIFK